MSIKLTSIRSNPNASTLIGVTSPETQFNFSYAPLKNDLKGLERLHAFEANNSKVGGLKELACARLAVTAASKKAVNALTVPQQAVTRPSEDTMPELLEVARGVEANSSTMVADRESQTSYFVAPAIGGFVGFVTPATIGSTLIVTSKSLAGTAFGTTSSQFTRLLGAIIGTGALSLVGAIVGGTAGFAFAEHRARKNYPSAQSSERL